MLKRRAAASNGHVLEDSSDEISSSSPNAGSCRETRATDMDVITDYIGHSGRIQIYVLVFSMLFDVPGAILTYSMTFFAPNVDFWCSRPANLKHLSVQEWMNYSSPLEAIDGKLERSRCKVFDLNFEDLTVEHLKRFNPNGMKTKKCRSWEFDHNFYRRTLKEEFQLVCDNDYLISSCNSAYMIGYMIGVFAIGHFADRFGRRKVILATTAVSGLLTVLTAFSTSFVVFVILRSIQCLFRSGASLTNYVLFSELFSSRYRSTAGNLWNLGSVVGNFSLLAMVYMAPDWVVVQLYTSLPYFLALTAAWFFPESPKWLMTQGKYTEAQQTIHVIAKINGIRIPDDKIVHKQLVLWQQDAQGSVVTKVTRDYSMLDLFKHPRMRNKTLRIYFCWMTVSFVFYGLSFNTNGLGGDPVMTYVISSAAEGVALFVATYVSNVFGRKVPLSLSLIMAGITCFSQTRNGEGDSNANMIYAMVGKFFISVSYALIYVYSAEIFPTVIRNIGMGTSSMAGRAGSILAPYTKELANYNKFMLPIVYGALGISSGISILSLPETRNERSPDTIEEQEKSNVFEIERPRDNGIVL